MEREIIRVEGCPLWFAYQNWYMDETERLQSRWNPLSVVFIAALIAALTFAAYQYYTCRQISKRITIQSHYTDQQKSFINFFIRHGSPVPEEMAVAVTQTKRPALMAAIAVKESNGNPKAVGDSGNAKGAFQVWGKHWGKVPSTATEQALQAERILDELVADAPRGSLRRGLAAYNGGSRPPRAAYRYADHVIKLHREVKK